MTVPRVITAGEEYDGIFNDELNKEFEQRMANYEATLDQCTSVPKRKAVMQLFSEKMKDLALKARLAEDRDLRFKCNQVIDNMRKRTFKGGMQW